VKKTWKGRFSGEPSKLELSLSVSSCTNSFIGFIEKMDKKLSGSRQRKNLPPKTNKNSL
jgi:hypothetical protein